MRDGHNSFMSLAGWLLAAAGLIAMPAVTEAGNGLNLIGFGTESITMGGADLAVARDASAMNINPAGLTQTGGHRLDLYAATAFLFGVGHRDVFGNDAKVANTPQHFASLGYAARTGDSGFFHGIGLFAQGGAGYEYSSLQTAFGTRDELSSLLRIVKLTPSLAYRWNDELSIGASLGIVYGDIEQNVFPDSSFQHPDDPAAAFFGYRLRDARGVSLGARLGMQYRPAPRITIGASYTSASRLDLEDGNLVVDMSAAGLGKVRYRDASTTGLRLPREVATGLAVQVSERLLVAADIGWIEWSRAVDVTRLTANGADHPDAPGTLDLESTHGWRDQWVYAIGMRYESDGGTILRAGYNYGRNPIPNRHLNPLLASTAEHHLGLGFGYTGWNRWSLDGGIEYIFRNRIVFTNPALPFGENAESRGEAAAIHLTLSRLW